MSGEQVEDGRGIVRALLEAWPDDSVPSGPLCVRAANYINRAQEPAPVAWRVRDFADGWILCHTEAQARAGGAGNLVQPLYAQGPHD